MNDLVSVIMPYYKKEDYFLQSINSVLNQTYSNLEIIVIYDDKKRSDAKNIEGYINNDPRVKLIYNGQNHGVAFSRNKAISLAQGEYISFLDCDDYWEINKIEIQLQFMLTNGYDFSHTTYHIIDHKDKIIGTVTAPKLLQYKDLMKSCDIGLSSVILKRQVLSDLRFPELKTKEDFVLWLGISKKSIDLVGLNNPLLFWRKTPNSASSSIPQKLKDAYRVYNSYENKNFFYSIFYIIRLCFYALIKKIKSSRIQDS